MTTALEHIRYSCGIAGEEVANYVDELERVVSLDSSLIDELRAKLAAAQEEILIERANGDHWSAAYSKWVNTDESARRLIELQDQLAAAQEENGRLENQVLARDAELWGRTQEILGLKDQLAKAEQRVAEACALTYLEDYDLTDIADRVRDGEWRKFVKEV